MVLCALPIPCRQDYLSIKNGWGPSGAENKNQTATERLKQKVAFSRLRGIGKKKTLSYAHTGGARYISIILTLPAVFVIITLLFR